MWFCVIREITTETLCFLFLDSSLLQFRDLLSLVYALLYPILYNSRVYFASLKLGLQCTYMTAWCALYILLQKEECNKCSYRSVDLSKNCMELPEDIAFSVLFCNKHVHIPFRYDCNNSCIGWEDIGYEANFSTGVNRIFVFLVRDFTITVFCIS